MMDFANWRKRKVLVTGHTGFKGSWLCLWLNQLGADVSGLSLAPPSQPSLFAEARVDRGMNSIIDDVTSLDAVQRVMMSVGPDIVIHMAAQSLVRPSYQEPIKTFQTNIMGTANILEAARHCQTVRTVLVVTSDKCYENREQLWSYRENDLMGGHDPYSCSKGCAELITSSYQRAYFAQTDCHLASVRAGNVIGGGDWAADRLIPDLVRALGQHEELKIRSPHAVRPWQHVLEPLAGYLTLADRLVAGEKEFLGGWNFGPDESHAWTVERVADTACRLWGPQARWHNDSRDNLHEAKWLSVDSTKARRLLGWKPVLSMEETLEQTIQWYKSWQQGLDPRQLTLDQIISYQQRIGQGE